jgi:hypothetical protein
LPVVDLAAARAARMARLGQWTADELALRRNFGIAGAPGTFDSHCVAAQLLGLQTRAAAVEQLRQRRRQDEQFLAEMSAWLDVAGWRHVEFEPEIAGAIEDCDRTIRAVRRILVAEDAARVDLPPG